MKPITPLCGCDAFVMDAHKRVLLIKRTDNQTWALPGGCHDLNETPLECVERECLEESGFVVRAKELIGVYSSNRYEYKYYPYPENQFVHLLFVCEMMSGAATPSSESSEVGWFLENELPVLNDGHELRIRHGFEFFSGKLKKPYFE